MAQLIHIKKGHFKLQLEMTDTLECLTKYAKIIILSTYSIP